MNDIELNRKIYESKYLKDRGANVYEPFLEVIAKIIKQNNYKTILDYGCGNGKVGFFLRSYLKGYEYFLTGADISEEGLKNAKPYYDSMVLVNGLEIPNFQFDFIVLNSVIEHIYPQNLETLFKDIKTRLTVGGALFVVVPNINSIYRLLRGREKALLEEKNELGHVNMMTKKEIVSFLKKMGLSSLQFSFFCNFKDLNLLDYHQFGSSRILRFCYNFTNMFPMYYLKNSFWVLAKYDASN